jgi:hypothetical protein
MGRIEGEGFYDMNLPAGGEATDYNFGLRGLRAEFISLAYFLASTPPVEQLVLELTRGLGVTSFRADRNGTLQVAAAAGEAAASLELYTADLFPVALVAGGQTLNASVAEGESYVLLVTGPDGALDLDVSIQRWLPVLLTNAANPCDVDGNGHVTPVDVLLVINVLNGGAGGPPGTQESDQYLDVNGDGQLTALDVLQVINFLNGAGGAAAPRSAAEGEAPAAPAVWALSSVEPPAWLPTVAGTGLVTAPAVIADRRDPATAETVSSLEQGWPRQTLRDNAALSSDRLATEWGSQDDDTLDALLVEPLLPILAEDAVLMQ